MHRIPALLQLLLIATLVLNGIGTASAGAAVQVPAALVAAAGGGAMPMEHSGHGECITPVGTPAQVPGDACCGDAGYCDFACAQVIAVVPPTLGPALPHRGGVHLGLAPPGHETPLLAGVTRPPIA